MQSTDTKLAGAGDAGGNVVRTVDQASTTVHRAIDKASSAARPAVDRVAASAHEAVDRLAGVATETAETIGARGSQMMEAQSRLAENCRGYIRERPMTSLGVAVAAGFLLSWALSRR